jgi:superfamily II DNA or RNA helicase/HKD family nuclease
MDPDLVWAQRFRLDINYGYVGGEEFGTGDYTPRLVLNQDGSTVEHAIVEELKRCDEFTFSVAFISPGAIAQLKQHLLDYEGTGRIITSDFLGFNSPRAFAELLNLKRLCGIDVRRHRAEAFHPKGYVFRKQRGVTAMIGSSNLTSRALSQNHEWNLKVSAASGSDLALQLDRVLAGQISCSEPLTQEWIDDYAATYVAPPLPGLGLLETAALVTETPGIRPNAMQQDALIALDLARAQGASKAIIISATGTGKTMLSALDVRAMNPRRLLFLVHREQILDRTISEYQRVLGEPATDFGKLTGSHKQLDRRFVFATIQSLSKESVLSRIPEDAFDYIIFDEAHRSGAATYQCVMEHFRPTFMLGMTATPERTDGFNVFELFDYNVPYEIRLQHALEAEILCPFHYYGVTDVTYDDGTTTSDATTLGQLSSPDRVKHLLDAMERYSQAGVPPRGLIFCSRKEEARALSEALNAQVFRGAKLRTVALTGDDRVETRERRVEELEAGLLDYILTVDVFNEGVDIPTVNQVVMLRQTQSAIVFVQQLGRGLRLAEGKDHLIVIDVIGNYTTNYLIPIALFGDESLNRESLRERLTETVEAGALPGLSSVSFDKISRERILTSIKQARLDSMANLKTALLAMQYRVGGVPTLWDFLRFESVDPVLLATKKAHYPALVESLLKQPAGLTEAQSRALHLLSHEVLAGKRLQEFVLLELLITGATVNNEQVADAFAAEGLLCGPVDVQSAIDTLTLRGYSQTAVKRYGSGIAEEQDGGGIRLTKDFAHWYTESPRFYDGITDLMKTGRELTARRYRQDQPFTPGMQYTRQDAAHILGWTRSTSSTIYGVKTDEALGGCAIFVTLHKSEEVTASTAYQDELLDTATMRWFTKSNRTLQSRDVAPIVEGKVDLHVFVKKDDAEGGDHYYLGQATAHEAIETTMPDAQGEKLPVVSMLLRFESPISQGLFDYFAPSTTATAPFAGSDLSRLAGARKQTLEGLTP